MDAHFQKKQRAPSQKSGRAEPPPTCDGRGGGGFVNPLCMYVADLDLTHDCTCTLTHPAGRIAGTTRGCQAAAVFDADADCSPCLKWSWLKADFNSLLCC